MKDRILNAIAVIACVVAFVAVIVPQTDDSTASASLESIASTRAEFGSSLSALLQEQTEARARDKVTTDTLADHTQRLQRIENAIEEQARGPTVEPPELLVPPAGADPAGYTAGLAILAVYGGKPWFQRESRGNKQKLIEHLAEHGFPTDGLERFSNSELERIHGAIHTQHESARGYSAQPVLRIPPGRGASPTMRPPMLRRVLPGNRIRTRPRPMRVQSCPGGVCPVQMRRL